LQGKKEAQDKLSNPNLGGMGGMGGMGGNPMMNMFTQMMMQNPDLMSDPEVMNALNDPTLMQKLNYYQQTGNIQAMFSDPQITALMQKLQGKKKGKEETSNMKDDTEVPESTTNNFSNNNFTAPKEEKKPEVRPTNSQSNNNVQKKKESANKLFKEKKYEAAIKE